MPIFPEPRRYRNPIPTLLISSLITNHFISLLSLSIFPPASDHSGPPPRTTPTTFCLPSRCQCFKRDQILRPNRRPDPSLSRVLCCLCSPGAPNRCCRAGVPWVPKSRFLCRELVGCWKVGRRCTRTKIRALPTTHPPSERR